MKVIVSIATLVFLSLALAEEKKGGFRHESELTFTQNESRPYAASAKDSTTSKISTKSEYEWSWNVLTQTGSYLVTGTKTDDLEELAAHQWLLGLRYDRFLGKYMTAFLGYSIEGDIAKYDTQTNIDLGSKYYFIKKEHRTLLTELGYRYTETDPLASTPVFNQSAVRSYTEYQQQITETMDGKIFVEYVHNVTKPTVNRVKAKRPGSKLVIEPSISVKMTSIFFLKSAFTFTEEEVANNGSSKQASTTRIYSTSLLAKF